MMFITFEGIEGSGKTTQISRLQAHLNAQGRKCILTREPGGTRLGQKIRSILLDPQNGALDRTGELLLYLADRIQHLNEVIRPHLKAGHTVLCDRYYDATLAYQGYARGIDIHLIRRLQDLLHTDLKPDITFLLDLEPGRGLARAWKEIDAGQRCGGETRFEKEALLFHEKVRAGYLSLAREEPERIKVVDATQDELEVHRMILNLLNGPTTDV